MYSKNIYSIISSQPFHPLNEVIKKHLYSAIICKFTYLQPHRESKRWWKTIRWGDFHHLFNWIHLFGMLRMMKISWEDVSWSFRNPSQLWDLSISHLSGDRLPLYHNQSKWWKTISNLFFDWIIGHRAFYAFWMAHIRDVSAGEFLNGLYPKKLFFKNFHIFPQEITNIII